MRCPTDDESRFCELPRLAQRRLASHGDNPVSGAWANARNARQQSLWCGIDIDRFTEEVFYPHLFWSLVTR